MIRTLVTAAVILLLLAGALLALVWWQQERVVFRPPPPPPPEDVSATRLDFRGSDGQPLLAYLVGDRDASRPLLIAFHGNADLAIWQISWAEELARRTGWRVLLAEYRGYGGLPGTPTYAATRADARSTLEFARDSLGADTLPVALYGYSLGAAVAVELAVAMDSASTEPQRASDDSSGGRFAARPHALMLIAPFTSAAEMARGMMPPPLGAAWRSIARVHYDTERRVRALDVPVWVAHGADDRTIPARMGQRVFESARSKGELLIVPGADHVGVESLGGASYWAWVGRALGSGA
jgi:pimeloyl-ACP methyl ester carboxylesterase